MKKIQIPFLMLLGSLIFGVIINNNSFITALTEGDFIFSDTFLVAAALSTIIGIVSLIGVRYYQRYLKYQEWTKQYYEVTFHPTHNENTFS